MKFQLVAKVKDPELLRKSMHELGTVFYQTDDKGNVTLIVYFSGSRIVHYSGKVEEDLAKLVRALGYQVAAVEFDEIQGYIKIVQ